MARSDLISTSLCMYKRTPAQVLGCIVGIVMALFTPSALAQVPRSIVDLAPELQVTEVAPQVFVVTHSYPWPANSMFVLEGASDVVFVDTPYTPEATNLLLDWITETFGRRNMLEINTGYHFDNLGGNKAFIDRHATVIASDETARLIEQRGEAARRLFLQLTDNPRDREYHSRYLSLAYIPPTQTFPLEQGLSLSVAGDPIEVLFPGETHAPDNVVVYFPKRKLLFGGCMILAGTGIGNSSEANIPAWATSIARLRSFDLQIIVPGHGQRYDPGLMENTLNILAIQ